MHALPAGLRSPCALARSNSYASSPLYGMGTPEVETACPQPLRALPSLPVFSHELFDSHELPEHRAHHCPSEWRPLSSASTCVGLTPSPEDGAAGLYRQQRSSSASTSVGPTPSLEHDQFSLDPRSSQHSPQLKQHRLSGTTNASTPGFEEAFLDSEVGGDKMPPQLRKVFVGGIPQDLGQDELHVIFSEYGEVQRAWLQRCRSTTCAPRPSAQPQHRGFGFIIFTDCAAVDRLLSGVFSRYLKLTCGRRLEVKRAISSERMPQTPPPMKGHVPRAELSDSPHASETTIRQRKVSTPQPQSPTPPGALWITGSDDDWRNRCSDVNQGIKAPVVQQKRSTALQVTAPPYSPGGIASGGAWQAEHQFTREVQTASPGITSWTAGKIEDWRNESPSAMQASDGSHWTNFANASQVHTTPAVFPPWPSDGTWQEGQHAAMMAPMAAVTHVVGCGAALPMGFTGMESLEAPAHTAVLPSAEWTTPVMQWPHLGAAQMDDLSKSELAAILRGATPEFYED